MSKGSPSNSESSVLKKRINAQDKLMNDMAEMCSYVRMFDV
jgi:hypothetical protein